MSSVMICDICGLPILPSHDRCVITVGPVKEPEDPRLKMVKYMDLHLNCAVDVKNAILNLRKDSGYNKRTIHNILSDKEELS